MDSIADIQDKLKAKAQAAYWTAQSRCTNPKVKGYDRYGGRGIKCLFTSSQELIDHVGLPPTLKHTIDRIDNDGNYEPGNLRWVSKMTQANNRRTNLFLEIDGEKKTMAEWSRVSGINQITIGLRYTRRKWPAKESVFLPLGTRYSPNVCKGSKHKKKITPPQP